MNNKEYGRKSAPPLFYFGSQKVYPMRGVHSNAALSNKKRISPPFLHDGQHTTISTHKVEQPQALRPRPSSTSTSTTRASTGHCRPFLSRPGSAAADALLAGPYLLGQWPTRRETLSPAMADSGTQTPEVWETQQAQLEEVRHRRSRSVGASASENRSAKKPPSTSRPAGSGRVCHSPLGQVYSAAASASRGSHPSQLWSGAPQMLSPASARSGSMEAIYNNEIDRIMQRVQAVDLVDSSTSFHCVKLSPRPGSLERPHAPVAELLARMRSVDTQTPDGIGSLSAAAGAGATGSSMVPRHQSPLCITGRESTPFSALLEDLEDEEEEEELVQVKPPAAALRPICVREPPDGAEFCATSPLESRGAPVGEELELLKPRPQPWKPSAGSAFQPLQTQTITD